MFLQGDTKKEKWKYFKDYYLWTFIVCGGLAITGICFLYTSFFGYRKTAVDILFVDSEELKLDQIKNDLENVLDTEGEEIVVEQLSEEIALSQTILPTRIAAGDVDLLIVNRKIFQEYAGKGIMEDLLEVLPDELYKKVEEHLVFEIVWETDVYGEVEKMEEKRPYGISLQNMDCVKHAGITISDPVVGILKGTDDLDLELEVLQYFVK